MYDYLKFLASIPYTDETRNLALINELTNIENPKMNQTLRTQADAISAIRSNVYLVGSVSTNGDFSVSPTPSVHLTGESARVECKRLAAGNPGKMFYFFRLGGGEMVPTSTLSI